MSELKARISNDMKQAMRDKAKERLQTLRLILAAFKQKEVDERIELTDEHILQILETNVKQRRDSIRQYVEGAREDLADKERAELEIIAEYMPEPLGEDEIDAMVKEAIAESGASTMREMGQVMGILKPKMLYRADMSKVSGKIKAQLNS